MFRAHVAVLEPRPIAGKFLAIAISHIAALSWPFRVGRVSSSTIAQLMHSPPRQETADIPSSVEHSGCVYAWLHRRYKLPLGVPDATCPFNVDFSQNPRSSFQRKSWDLAGLKVPHDPVANWSLLNRQVITAANTRIPHYAPSHSGADGARTSAPPRNRRPPQRHHASFCPVLLCPISSDLRRGIRFCTYLPLRLSIEPLPSPHPYCLSRRL
jgi:hypothetical protein